MKTSTPYIHDKNGNYSPKHFHVLSQKLTKTNLICTSSADAAMLKQLMLHTAGEGQLQMFPQGKKKFCGVVYLDLHD